MKAISIRQPWARAVIHYGKRIENRAWENAGSLLGQARRAIGSTILIHASKWWDAFEVKALFEGPMKEAMSEEHRERMRSGGPVTLRMLQAETGGIVGQARLDGLIFGERDFAAYAANVRGGEEQRAWWTGGFALVFADVEPLPFVGLRGALGFFDVDQALLKVSA